MLLILLACSGSPKDTALTPATDTSTSETVETTDTERPSDTDETAPVDTHAPVDTAIDTEPSETDACVLSIEVEPLHLMEGDTARFTPRCDADGWRIEPLSLTANMLWDGTTLAWSTGVADSGEQTVRFTAAPIAGDVFPETGSATVWIADNSDAPGNLPPDPLTYTEEWGLPVLHVSSTAPLTQSYTPAQIYFDGVGYDAEIKIRGASSASYAKNSFTLNFGEENLDTGGYLPHKKDRLVLITTLDDNSAIRQKLAYDLWSAIADFWEVDRLTPRTFFTVVYLDGEYHGLYTAADHVDDEFVAEMGLKREGNLYKSVNHDANFERKRDLHAGYEKKEGEPLDDFSDLDALVWFTGQDDTETFLAEADQWLQIEEFMDWLLFVHFTSADDSGGKNAYLYNDPDDTEFRYVPWDFNHAFGQSWQTVRIDPDINNDFRNTNHGFDHLHTDPATAEILWTRLRTLMDDGPLSATWFEETLDAYEEQIQPGAERDWAKWGAEYERIWSGVRGGCSDCMDYAGETVYIREWLDQRDFWMRTLHP